jgi:hypothetical protein
MYDKKNFFPHTHKKNPPKNRPPTTKKKGKKRAEITHKKTASEGKRKKNQIKNKITGL